jgi:nucleotide-binding universal stress UspA family protein
MTELPNLRKILLATDGSEAGGEAALYGLGLAKQTGASVRAIYVVDTHRAFSLGIHRDDAARELRDDGQRALAALDEVARRAGIEIETELGDGHPGEAIVREADQSGAGLIVVGSHGQGRLADVLLGSTSQYVIHHAGAPVCVVRPSGGR